MRHLITLVCAFTLTTIAYSQVGLWKVEGTNTDGTAYQASLYIDRSNDIYELIWQLSDEKVTGIGFMEGGVLFAAWGRKENFGVGVYKMGKGGTLEGEWISRDTKSYVGKESATGGTEGQFAGTYSTKGADANGAAYEGTVTITESEGTYRLEWKVGEKTFQGIGFAHDGYLVCGWGSPANYGLVLYTFSEDNQSGQSEWIIDGTKGVGKETIQRKN